MVSEVVATLTGFLAGCCRAAVYVGSRGWLNCADHRDAQAPLCACCNVTCHGTPKQQRVLHLCRSLSTCQQRHQSGSAHPSLEGFASQGKPLASSLTHPLPALQLAGQPAVPPAPRQWDPCMRPVRLPRNLLLRPGWQPSNSSADAWRSWGKRFAAGWGRCSGSSCPRGNGAGACGVLQHAAPRWQVCWVQVGQDGMPFSSVSDRSVCICDLCMGSCTAELYIPVRSVLGPLARQVAKHLQGSFGLLPAIV